MAPFHIKAQILRQSQLEPASALAIFEPRAGQGNPSSDEAPASGKRQWRQSDVKRMIAAAEQAGLQSYRIELAPDGALSIIVGAPEETAGSTESHQDSRRT
jgi:hypothetical protein